MGNTKSPILFYIALVVTAVALLFCIYQLVPNIYHVPVPVYAEPTKVHEKYVALFAGLAVLGIIGALITRPKTRQTYEQRTLAARGKYGCAQGK